jgi:WD40 repeat protein
VLLALWEPDTDKILWTRTVGSGHLFATFTADGARFVFQEYYRARVPVAPALPVPPGPYPFVVLDAATGKELIRASGTDLGKQPLVSTTRGAVPGPNAKAISPNGKTLAISGWDGTIYLWDLATDRQIAKFTHPGPVHELAFSPDGTRLAAASFAAPVLVYDLSALNTKR